MYCSKRQKRDEKKSLIPSTFTGKLKLVVPAVTITLQKSKIYNEGIGKAAGLTFSEVPSSPGILPVS